MFRNGRNCFVNLSCSIIGSDLGVLVGRLVVGNSLYAIPKPGAYVLGPSVRRRGGRGRQDFFMVLWRLLTRGV